jgi:hypothetical protein
LASALGEKFRESLPSPTSLKLHSIDVPKPESFVILKHRARLSAMFTPSAGLTRAVEKLRAPSIQLVDQMTELLIPARCAEMNPHPRFQEAIEKVSLTAAMVNELVDREKELFSLEDGPPEELQLQKTVGQFRQLSYLISPDPNNDNKNRCEFGDSFRGVANSTRSA